MFRHLDLTLMEAARDLGPIRSADRQRLAGGSHQLRARLSDAFDRFLVVVAVRGSSSAPNQEGSARWVPRAGPSRQPWSD